MSLLSRLVGSDSAEVKLSVHSFMAALSELKRGAPGVTVTTIGDYFGLSAQERTELAGFAGNQFGEYITRELVHDVLLLGESGAYTLQQCADRLVTPSGQNLLPLLVQRQVQILARSVNDCVLSGCAVTAQGSPDMTLAVAKGAVVTNGILRAVAAGNVNIAAADSSSPRFDLVVVDSSGVKQVREGIAGPTPTPPALSAGDVALCFVYVAPGDTGIQTGELSDARVMTTSGPLTLGKVTTPVVFNNTAAAQNYVNLTLPSGFMGAGKVCRVRMGGTMLLNSGTPTVTLRIAYGGTTMFQDVTGAATADTDRLSWHLDFVLVASSLTSQLLSGQFLLSLLGAKTAPTTGVGDIAGAAALVNPFSGSAAVDSDAADRALQVQFTMSVANPANEIAMDYATGVLE